jgi:hypothetical protein
VKKAVARLAPNDSFSYPERAACTGHPLLLPTRSNTAQKPAHLHSCVCLVWKVVVLRIISRRSAAPITENVADLEAGVYRTCSPMLSREVEVGCPLFARGDPSFWCLGPGQSRTWRRRFQICLRFGSCTTINSWITALTLTPVLA